MSAPVISIVDYGVCNLGSITNMLHRLEVPSELVSTPEAIHRARKLILPGVGAFDNGMRALAERDLVEPLRTKGRDGATPILGICLGMQLLGAASEEGKDPGLAVIDGRCLRFQLAEGSRWRVPHMGWNEIEPLRQNPLLAGLESGARFYFTHSYHMVCASVNDVLARAHHGIEFTAIIQRSNVYGVQFHPEKSHRFGMTLLRNFSDLPC